MTTIAFPTIGRKVAEVASWDLVASVFVHSSPYTGSTDTIEMPGARWAFSATWRALLPADRGILEAWLAKLSGRSGRFYFSHPKQPFPRGTARGTGTCSAASQFATAVTLNGLTNGTTLLEGDFIEIGTAFLVRVVDPVTISGATAVNVRPMLRTAVANATAFTLTRPRAQFMLNEDRQGIGVRSGFYGQGLGDFTLEAIEAF